MKGRMAPPAPSHRPSPGGPEEPAPQTTTVLSEDARVSLRLTASSGALGIELYEPVDLGALTVLRLALSLPGLKFPIDLSGGVPRFRHRRGELEALTFEAELGKLEAFLEPRLRSVISSPIRAPTLWMIPGGVGVGLLGESSALAFDLLFLPDGGAARLLVDHARGVGLGLPPLGAALHALDSMAGGLGERRGRVLRIPDVGKILGRLLLPAVGARVPGSSRVRFAALDVEGQRLRFSLDSEAAPPELPLRATSALELSRLVEDADDALCRGEVEAARAGYVQALEQAPRHPEIVQLVAEIDVSVAARLEAALGLLIETLPATDAGLIGARLLAASGDPEGARAAVARASEGEPFAPLAAAQWVFLAEIDPDPAHRSLSLDRAVARSPGLPSARAARFRARLARGDVDGALADAEHLEALQIGARARHDACRFAARELLDAGRVREAGRLFERALRYAPDDAASVAGLGRALLLGDQPVRAVTLLERAVELGERAGRLDGDALIDLARILADRVRDLPQAIARVRQVPAASDRLVEARFLEGTWRARLGDIRGATLAFGRMREAVELSSEKKPTWARWLREAAESAIALDGDVVGAERHLAVALGITPRDAALGERYREVAREVASRKP